MTLIKMNTHWDIVHFDLSSGETPAELTTAPEVGRGVFAVLWWKQTPLGHTAIEASRLPLSSKQLADLVLTAISPALDSYLAGAGLVPYRQRTPKAVAQVDPRRLLRAALSLLESLPELKTTAAASEPRVSVVVPTRDRPGRLAACLRSLSELDEKPLEILVVDNAPSAATRQVVESFSGVRYVVEPRTGSSAARNTGVHQCRGELVAFVDDDETVHPDWLSRLRSGFSDPEVALVTGLVLPAELETEAQLIFEQRYSFARGYVARTFDSALYRRTRRLGVPVWEIGGSGNMAIRRDVFERLGGFDERLGAGRAGGCEELELFYRALAEGWSCRYEPRAVTLHQHRRSLRDLERQLYAYMRGHVASALVQLARYRDVGNLRHLVWTLPKVYAGYGLRSLLRDPAYRGSMLRMELAGCLAGLGYYRRCRRLDARSVGLGQTAHSGVVLDGPGHEAAVVTGG